MTTMGRIGVYSWKEQGGNVVMALLLTGDGEVIEKVYKRTFSWHGKEQGADRIPRDY